MRACLSVSSKHRVQERQLKFGAALGNSLALEIEN